MTDDVRRARTALIWVGLIVPLTILALSSIVIAVWLPDIPNPAATHWGTDGVDGYGPAWTYIAMTAGLGGGLVVLFSVMALSAHKLPHNGVVLTRPWSPIARILGGMSLGLAVMFSLLSLISVGVQRGLKDATQTPDITGWVFVGLALAAAVGAVGWLVQPAVEQSAQPIGEPAEPLELVPSERAAWMRTASTALSGKIVLGAAMLLLVVQVVIFAALGDEIWILFAIVSALLLILIATMLVFRVTASARGLLVRSIAGWPRLRIPRESIRSARAVVVSPFADFGGWGYRIGLDGRRGIVLRAGDALEVTRVDGRVFVVTVEDAATAASVLTSVVKGDHS